MTGSVRFLTRDEVVALHLRLIQAFGGEGGLRDPGLLESALHRPRTGYYADLIQMAAALFESLLLNHPFVDGNKRVAFFATDVFLRLNGWYLEVEADPAHGRILDLLRPGGSDFAALEAWLRQAARPLS